MSRAIKLSRNHFWRTWWIFFLPKRNSNGDFSSIRIKVSIILCLQVTFITREGILKTLWKANWWNAKRNKIFTLLPRQIFETSQETHYQREKSFSITECTYDIEGRGVKTETSSTGSQHEHSHGTRSQRTQVDQRLPWYLGRGFLLFDFAALIL